MDEPNTIHAPRDAVFESTWPTGAAFLERYTSGPPALLDHPVPAYWRPGPHVVLGALMSVLLRFEDRDAEFHVHARVVELNTAGSDRKIVFEFLEEEKERLELVMTCVQGESFPYFKRRHPRVVARLPVRVGVDGLERDGNTTTINESGCHLASDELDADPDVERAFAVERRIRISILWPSGARSELRARVAERVPAGPQRGYGLEFLFASTEQRETVAAEVEALRAARGG